MLSDRKGPQPPEDLPDFDPIPEIVPALPRTSPHARNLPWRSALLWLRAGWKDTWTQPGPSLLYGLVLFVISALIVWGLFRFDLEYALFPALAGFMVIGPLIANGLYEKSRRIEAGQRTSFFNMVFVKPQSGAQGLFMGVLLLSLFMLWIRAAVLVWALFFGVVEFPGMDEIVPMLFFTPTGWALLLVGGSIGALFAAFSFAVSVFAVPMLLKEETDALSAMGISMAMVWNNLSVMLVWGAIVLALFGVSVLTGLVGLILVFPVLGHATWHAYRALRPEDRQSGPAERMFIQPA